MWSWLSRSMALIDRIFPSEGASSRGKPDNSGWDSISCESRFVARGASVEMYIALLPAPRGLGSCTASRRPRRNCVLPLPLLRVSHGHFNRYSDPKYIPLARNLRHIPSRNPPIQQNIHCGVKRANQAPPRQIKLCPGPSNQRNFEIKTAIWLLILMLRSGSFFESDIVVQGFYDLLREPADVGEGNVGAFRDLESVEGDEVDCVDSASFEGREDMRVWSDWEVREDG
ncbi:hypothetical protein BDV06DRAFT_88914 [Aspergillus oleicola]